MSIKEKVEENVVLWLLGMLVTGFLSGIGAYKAILEIAQLTVIPKSAEVASLSREVERLKAENKRIRDKKEEYVENSGQTKFGREEPRQAVETGKNRRAEAQTQESFTPKKDPELLKGKFTGTIILKDGSETECLELSFRDMHLNVFQYWWDPEKVKTVTEMPFDNIRSIRPGALRKIDNVSPDFVEVRLERVDGKAINVYSPSNYAFYCYEKNVPQPTAFPITQVKVIRIVPRQNA